MSSAATKVGSPPMLRRTSPFVRRASISFAGLDDVCPGVVAVGLRHPRRLTDARHRHLEVEGHFRLGVATADRRGAGRVRCGGKRDVAFAGEQPRGGIESDPSGAGQIDLSPGVEIGEVGVGTGRSIERFDVRLQLNEVAGNEARGEAEIAQDLQSGARRCRGTSPISFSEFLPASGRPAPCGSDS